jgi:exopolysaccharide/PEP-CTERM locus tyrosine autokinase
VSLIEQAAQRLEQLRNAGISVPNLRERPGQPQDARNEFTARPPGAPVITPVPGQPSRSSRRVVLDLAKLAKAGLITPDAPRSQIADEFRIVKRPLIANALGKAALPVDRGNLIMVTSALAGEGKTFTAANLAMSMAMELDSTVLLVDADVANPTVPAIFGLREPRGLMDLLTDPSMRVPDVLLRTNIDRLSLLPAGKAHRRATELLASDAMARLLREIASRYPDRIVICDAPPLLPTTESRALAMHMGQIVVVVEADRTTHSTLKHALAMVEDCPVVMTMLNKAARSDVGSYYGYYGHAQQE